MTDTTDGGDVRLSGISKHYGTFTAVHPLDLTVPQAPSSPSSAPPAAGRPPPCA